jgi:hypothetical protein
LVALGLIECEDRYNRKNSKYLKIRLIRDDAKSTKASESNAEADPITAEAAVNDQPEHEVQVAIDLDEETPPAIDDENTEYPEPPEWVIDPETGLKKIWEVAEYYRLLGLFEDEQARHKTAIKTYRAKIKEIQEDPTKRKKDGSPWDEDFIKDTILAKKGIYPPEVPKLRPPGLPGDSAWYNNFFLNHGADCRCTEKEINSDRPTWWRKAIEVCQELHPDWTEEEIKKYLNTKTVYEEPFWWF